MEVSVFGGKGFIGSQYVKRHGGIVQARENYTPATANILYLISTVDNYNIFTDPHIDINTNLNVLIDVLEEHRKRNGTEGIFNFVSSWFVYGQVEIGRAHV